MATKIWSAPAAGNWNVDANWSGGAVPTVDDEVVFDTTSTYGCTVDISPSINSFVATAAYSGNITFSGQTLTVALGFSDDGTGTRNYGNGIAANGASSTVHFGSTLGTVMAASCMLMLNGTTAMVYDNDKGISFAGLVLGSSAIAALGGSQYTFFIGTTPLTFTNGGTLSINQPIGFTKTSSGSIFVIGGTPTINGTNTIYLAAAVNSATVTMPALTVSNTGGIVFDLASGFSNATWRLEGNISSGAGANIVMYNTRTGVVVYDLNGFGVTCNIFRCGCQNSGGGTLTLNAGSGSSNIASFDGATYNQAAAVTTINLQTYQWLCSGNWTFGSNHTITGTSTVTITNTSTVTSNGKSFYNFVINAAGRTITLADTLTIATGGSITVTAFTAFAGSQYIVFAGSGSITISTAVSNRLRTAVAGSTITWNTGANTWTIPAYTANDWGGTSGSYVLWRSSTPGSQYKISAPAGVAIGYMNIQDCNNTGTLIDAKATANTDSGNNLGIDFAVVIDTVTPGSGVAGTTVTISGHSFLSPRGTGKVEFIIAAVPIEAASYVSWSDTQIVVTTPAGSGAADVKVTSSDGDTATAAGAFTMISAKSNRYRNGYGYGY